jgi:pentachlorophenol monooxygenase
VTTDDVASLERVAEAVVVAAHGHVDVYLIAAPDADVATTLLPLIRDSARDFARMYVAGESAVYVVRPDGYLSFTGSRVDADELVAHLCTTFGASVSTTATPDLR